VLDRDLIRKDYSEEKTKMSAPALKKKLEELLKERRLRSEAPPLHGERQTSPLASGIGPIDGLVNGGIPRGQLSEIHGPSSSGRTGIALSLVARSTVRGALAAWVDPSDRLDPGSAQGAGVDLERLLWLRGREGALPEALAATVTLLDAGLFEIVVLDVAGVATRDLRRLPGATWIRLQRAVAETRAALLLVAAAHVATGPCGVRLALEPARPRWSGSGPGRLLSGLGGGAVAGRHATRRAGFELAAL
jgi:hypothetical protein